LKKPKKVLPMSSEKEIAIDLNNVSKTYKIYSNPIDRLKESLRPIFSKTYHTTFHSLQPVSISVLRGEVLGVVGLNGAGKSTLLQLMTGVIQPTSGNIQTNGRIAALLELGAGFNPEFSGRDNVFLNASLLGLSHKETLARYDDIVEFSGIGEHINKKVKTYSSGMYVRLAFSIATAIDPDILIIDEALSVGDGQFSRKSFDRIMNLKKKGVTIIFCSHNVYQVEALSDRVLWIDKGKLQSIGPSSSICQQYNNFLQSKEDPTKNNIAFETNTNMARLLNVTVDIDGKNEAPYELISNENNLNISVSFWSSDKLPIPNVAIIIDDENGRNISSCSTFYDNVTIHRDNEGVSTTKITFPKFSLLRGKYTVHIFLLCESGIHIYDAAQCAELSVSQPGLEIGIVSLERNWQCT